MRRKGRTEIGVKPRWIEVSHLTLLPRSARSRWTLRVEEDVNSCGRRATRAPFEDWTASGQIWWGAYDSGISRW